VTQLELARKGMVSAAMKAVAEKEGLDPEFVRQGVAEGLIVIPANTKHHGVEPCGIGKGCALRSTPTLALLRISPMSISSWRSCGLL